MKKYVEIIMMKYVENMKKIYAGICGKFAGNMKKYVALGIRRANASRHLYFCPYKGPGASAPQ